MQTKSTSYGKKLLALMLSLLMLVSVLPVSAWAAADAKPEKITLVGSSDALEYEFSRYVEYTASFENIPLYKVCVPTGTKTVQLYGTVYVNTSSGSSYVSEADFAEWMPGFEYWDPAAVGSSAPYTIETPAQAVTRQRTCPMSKRPAAGPMAAIPICWSSWKRTTLPPPRPPF